MSTRKMVIPEFGPLAGVRVISAGSIVAMPHAANMMADFGAEVIHIERPGVGDTFRGLGPFAEYNGKKVSTSWAQDARNRLSMGLELDLNVPEVKELFLDLIKETDIFMENLVWLEKYGISDELLLATNPKLVIVHVSGYGRPQFGGNPDVCDRASYDMIGQAASGFLFLNGDKDRPPAISKPWLNDYQAALTAVFGALVGYISAQKTGKGQSVDVAQFEAAARLLADTFVSYTEANVTRERTQASKADAFQPYGLFQDKNGDYLVIGAFGPGVYNRFIKAAGFDLEYFNFKDCSSSPAAVASEKGQELHRNIIDWVGSKTADEVVAIMSKAKVGCNKVYSAADAVKDEHWIDRGDFIEYEDQTIQKQIKAFGVIPKFSDTPGKVWRGAPTIGQDTEAIIKTILGYSEEKIQVLKDKKCIQ
ncbi:CoA transferase [Sporomusa sphaeroides DSM 2875]|uniref:CaiB/BaiF CoA transferase family protein n=1 Tax=Sporomusa sphaeroides TaxID=47679 RepID=UPI0020308E57|nr:CoA transferase [Sporomusa sphaeroides]MCM0760899.1 CoA transferase [Sporomusa sphaeroides DSM 2875]